MRESYTGIEQTPEALIANELRELRYTYKYEEGRPVEINDNIEGHREVRNIALEQIAELEKEKDAVMAWLGRTLIGVERGDDTIESRKLDARSVGYDENTKSLFVFVKKGERIEITQGELLSDGRWAIEYRLNSSVPKELRLKYYRKEAERALDHLHNQQIAWNESTRGENDFDEDAYRSILDREQAKFDHKELLDNGGLAEMVVSSLLERLSIDSGLDISIRETDPYQDVKGKIDLIIHFEKGHTRGARVEQSGGKDIGIQLTTSANEKLLTHKQQQIGRAIRRRESTINDVVLVSIPLQDLQNLHKRWQTESKKKLPGGLDKLLSSNQQEQIIRGIFAKLPPGIISEKDIERMLEGSKQYSLAA